MAEQLYFEDVNVGDEVPRSTERVNETQMFFFSAATYNGHRIHYDLPFAQSEGHPTILVHGPLQSALMAKTLRNWIGPKGRLRRLRAQNRASAYPNEDLIFTGRVIEKRQESGKNIVELDIWEEKEGGKVIMPGSAAVELPSRSG